MRNNNGSDFCDCSLNTDNVFISTVILVITLSGKETFSVTYNFDLLKSSEETVIDTTKLTISYMLEMEKRKPKTLQ